MQLTSAKTNDSKYVVKMSYQMEANKKKSNNKIKDIINIKCFVRDNKISIIIKSKIQKNKKNRLIFAIIDTFPVAP